MDKTCGRFDEGKLLLAYGYVALVQLDGINMLRAPRMQMWSFINRSARGLDRYAEYIVMLKAAYCRYSCTATHFISALKGHSLFR